MTRAPSDQLLPQLLADRARTSPDRICVTDLSADTTTTFAELDHEARAWAGALAGAGVGPLDTVATMLDSGATPLAVWTGLGWLRAINVPVNHEYRGEMLSHVLADSRASVLVIDGKWLDHIAEVAGAVPQLTTLIVVGQEQVSASVGDIRALSAESVLADAPAAGELRAPQPHDIACIVFTSGTTGKSKGVLIPWQQCVDCAVWSIPSEYLGDDDVAYMPFPSHHFSFLAPAYGMFRLGGGIVTRHRFSVSAYWDDVRTRNCTYGPLLGTMAHLLASAPKRPDDADNPMRFGAMVPVVDDLAAYEARFGVQIGTVFGMTELSIPLRSEEWRVAVVNGVASCGKVRPGVQARIVDENDWPVARGDLGELVIRHDEPWEMAAGYWNNPTATAETWRNGWFHTGDAMVQNEDGHFFHRDRLKDTIRRRGENISSAEVEALLLTHPGVAEVAAVAVPSPLGEDDVKVVVVAAAGSTVTAEALNEHAGATMPRFMRPRYIEFVDELPKTPTLKVRKQLLRAEGVTAATWDGEAV